MPVKSYTHMRAFRFSDPRCRWAGCDAQHRNELSGEAHSGCRAAHPDCLNEGEDKQTAERVAMRSIAKNRGSRGAVDPFFSASSSRKTLADLCHSLLTGFHRKKLRTIFLSSGSGLTANRKNRSTPRDPILPSTIRSCSPRPAGCYRPLPRPPSTCLRARNICHSLRP